MKYFLADYITRDGEHEYSEYAVVSARDLTSAEKKAKKGRKYFTRLGWEEFCELFHLQEIPLSDYKVLSKYFQEIGAQRLMLAQQ